MPRVYANHFTAHELQLILTNICGNLNNFECLILEDSDKKTESDAIIYEADILEESVYKILAASLIHAKSPINKLLILPLPHQEFAFISLTQMDAASSCLISGLTLSKQDYLYSFLSAVTDRLTTRYTRIHFELKDTSQVHVVINILQSIKSISPQLQELIRDSEDPDTRLEQGLALKFKAFPSLKAATLIATKQAIPLWLAMTTFTASSLVSLSLYGKHNADTLLTSVIVLTLQRVLWALTSTPLQSNLINISRAMTREPESIGKIVQAGWAFAALLGVMNALIASFAVGPLLKGFNLSDDLVSTSGDVFRAYAPGFVGYAFMDCNIKILIAFKKPLPVLLMSTLASTIGALSVYGFTNNKFGLENHEKEGYAYGLTIQSWLLAGLLFAYLGCSDSRKTYKLFDGHSGVLGELLQNIKEGIPIFFQRNADVFGTFGLALIASILGPVALITEDIIESYRLAFGRVGINSVSLALTGLMGNQMGSIKLVLDGKLRASKEQSLAVVNNIKMLRHAGFILTTIHSGLWFVLYATIPQQLASVFVKVEYYAQYPDLERTIRDTFLISGAGQFFDDFRQTYMAEFNAGKHLAVTTIVPNIGNFGLMTGLAYLLSISLDMGAEGLETANGILFLLVTACVFTPIANYYLNELLEKLMPKGEDLTTIDYYQVSPLPSKSPTGKSLGTAKLIDRFGLRSPRSRSRVDNSLESPLIPSASELMKPEMKLV
ncbi:MAG: hypothetical protein H0U75_09620 [Legionella sp.]|nr:hypothetical protein [Legionella sp.]